MSRRVRSAQAGAEKTPSSIVPVEMQIALDVTLDSGADDEIS
jgi:hypothetical protein